MVDRKTAFVLAGGGTKGAFEAGALRYLLEEECLVPDVVTAASAGAVAGTVIAQARSAREFAERSRDLEADLLAMTHTSLLFGSQPWYQALGRTPVGDAIDTYLTELTRPPVPGLPAGGRGDEPATLGWPDRLRRAARSGRGLFRTAAALPRARRALRSGAGSVLTLDPLAKALREGGPGGIRAVDPWLVARPGLELRLAVTGLRSGRLRYVTGDGKLVEDDAVTPVAGAGPVDVIEGVLASCSVPMVFPPLPLADDVYVDGGVLCNVPVDAAARLGAERIIAVLAVPLDLPPEERDFTHANAFEVLLRTMGTIALVDRQRTDLAHPLPAGTTLTVIDPTVDVVGPFEVAVGLMRVDMDYGWLRAADVLSRDHQAERQAAARATDALVTARVQAWYLEEELWSAGRPSRPAAALAALVGLKRAVREAAWERSKLDLPQMPGHERWWSGYEEHGRPAPSWLPAAPLTGSG